MGLFGIPKSKKLFYLFRVDKSIATAADTGILRIHTDGPEKQSQ